MERLTELSYEENGVVIVFTELFKEAPHLESYYEFEVEGDTELTEKLRKAVMNKRVSHTYLFDCASSLFEIIRSGDFEEAATIDRATSAFNKFVILIDEDPKFMVKKISTHPPRSKVTLFNCKGLKGVITAESRNVLTAKVKTVEEYIKQIGG